LSEADQVRLDSFGIDRTAEISRYAIAKRYRRRPSEREYPDVDPGDPLAPEFRRLAPHMSIGLIRGVCRLAARHNIDTVCAEMSLPLLRLLERFGLVFEKLGPLIDYHGPRQPCVAQCRDLLAGLGECKQEYYRLVTEGGADMTSL
jgi:N-acyl amino acid synthase of PEP-CTERM/exosortase system